MIKYPLLVLLLLLTISRGFSQDKQLNLFTDTATKYIVSIDAVKDFVAGKKNQVNNLKLSPGLSLKMYVNMNEWNDENTHTVGGRLIDYEDSYLTLTLFTYKGKLSVSGDIFSKKNATAFKIFLNDQGNISVEKTDKDKIIIE
ncbi:MAG: hypothetical protein ABJA37_09470 [Ferruginibacter sp.]